MWLCENSALWKICPMKNTHYMVLYVGGQNRSFSTLTWVTWISPMTTLCQGQTRTVSQKFSLNFSLIFTHSLWSCDVLWSPIWLKYYTVPWQPYVQKSALVLPCSLRRSELLVSTSGCSTLSTWLRRWLQRDCWGWQWSWQMSSKGGLNLGKEELGYWLKQTVQKYNTDWNRLQYSALYITVPGSDSSKSHDRWSLFQSALLLASFYSTEDCCNKNEVS